MEQSPGLFEFLNLRFHPRYEMGVTGMLLLTGLHFSVPGWMCTRTPFAHKAQRLVEMAESCKSLPVFSSSPQTLSLTRLSSKGTFSLSDTSESSVAKVNGEEKHRRGCVPSREGWVGGGPKHTSASWSPGRTILQLEEINTHSQSDMSIWKVEG